MDGYTVAQFSAFQQIKCQYMFLEKLKPSHELLALADVSQGFLGIRDVRGYRKRYIKEKSSTLQIMINYQIDLEKAVKSELENNLDSLGLLEMAKYHFQR